MNIPQKSFTPELRFIKEYVDLTNTSSITKVGGWTVINNNCDKLAKIFCKTANRFSNTGRKLEDWSEPMLEFISELHLLTNRYTKMLPIFEMRFVKLFGLPYICFTYRAGLDTAKTIEAFYLIQIIDNSFRMWMECFNYWMSGKDQCFLGKLFGKGKIISQISCSYYNNTVLCRWEDFLYNINYTTPEQPFLRLESTLIIPSSKSVFKKEFFKYRRILGRLLINIGFYPQWILM